MTELADIFGDLRFYGSREGDAVLGRLRRDFQLTEKWQVARLAIAASLAVPSSPEPARDREGSEIRGVTLFKRDGTGPALAAMAVSHAGRALDPDEIVAALEAHWDRGVNLLQERVDRAFTDGKGADSVLLMMAEEASLEKKAERSADGSAEYLDSKIVGQGAAKRIVGPLVRDALASDPVRLEGTLLFTGPASTGKTRFSKTIAETLDLPFVDTNGSVVRNIPDLLGRIEKACAESGSKKKTIATRGGLPVHLYPPAIVFIDECHAMPRAAQTALLTALEPTEREAKTVEEIADLSQVSFLLATTDSAKLLEPLRTRGREIPLEPYSRGEVAEIVRQSHGNWPTTVCQQLAVGGRLVPRQALLFAEDFDRFMRQEHPDERPSEHLVLRLMKSRGMDELGLTGRDYRYLALLPEDGSARGLQAIASQLHIDDSEVEEAVEPFLIQLRLVERETKGRRITSKGMELIEGHEF